jgi:predicted porin
VRKALVCAAAISTIAGVAHADELTDLKTQSQQLQQQNQMLIQRISQLEQRQQKIEAQQAAQPAARAEEPTPPIPADDGTLTWKGITLYGAVDIGVGYQSAGTPLNGDYGPGLEYLVSKNSNKSLISLAPNALSYSSVGLKGKEEILPGLSAIFNVQTQFVPTSGAIANGPQSQVDNNGVALNKQTSNGDSTRAGQAFLEAYGGLSSPVYGTITLGRQNSLDTDGIIAYDPLGGSNAFSVIGYSGAWGGGGVTQDTRLAGSVKYRVGVGPVRLAALYQAQGYGDTDQQSSYQFGAGTDFAGFSFDAVFSQVYGAQTVSPLSAAQFAVEPANSLAATISDNTAYLLLGKYNFGEGTLYAGYEHIQYDNPDHPLAADSSGLGGYLLSVVNNTAYNENKVLQIGWGGAKYDLTDDLTLTGAYYHEWQNSFATGKLTGCGSAKLSSGCSGNLNAVSLVADYRFTKRFDIYDGAMWSEVDGGLANGFLHDTTIDPTIGARFRF